MDESIDEGGPGRLQDLGLRGIRAPIGDVLSNGALEQPGVLEHHPYLRAEVGAPELGDVDAIEGDPAGVELVEPHHEVDQSGLPGTGGPDDGNRVTGLHGECQVIDEGPIFLVPEGDVLERHPSVGIVDHPRLVVVRHFLLGVEQLEDPLRGGDPGLEEVDHGCDLGDGLSELTRVLDECLDVTEAHGPAGHPETTEHGDDDVVEVPDEHHARHDQAGEELGREARLVETVVLGLEGLLDLLLPSEDLDQGVTGESLLDLGVECSRASPLGDEMTLGALHHRTGDQHRHRDRDQGDEGEGHRDVEHHADHEEHREHRVQHLAQRLLQALGNVVDVVGHPAQQLATGLAVEVAKGEPVELALDLGPHLHDRPLHHVVQQVPL